MLNMLRCLKVPIGKSAEMKSKQHWLSVMLFRYKITQLLFLDSWFLWLTENGLHRFIYVYM